MLAATAFFLFPIPIHCLSNVLIQSFYQWVLSSYAIFYDNEFQDSRRIVNQKYTFVSSITIDKKVLEFNLCALLKTDYATHFYGCFILSCHFVLGIAITRWTSLKIKQIALRMKGMQQNETQNLGHPKRFSVGVLNLGRLPFFCLPYGFKYCLSSARLPVDFLFTPLSSLSAAFHRLVFDGLPF